ncbi:hypothetical protein BD410DRAFT_784799 [Rickenella mellea]|uniref:Uncharacterized protein n=1 Tax=Rickenella mellea TaxID=50990 RepID=A0A4Y7QEL7_9AGAM|nr:hypothetical protein BD410DRAFT_784799 [Rickenella mellea]
MSLTLNSDDVAPSGHRFSTIQTPSPGRYADIRLRSNGRQNQRSTDNISSTIQEAGSLYYDSGFSELDFDDDYQQYASRNNRNIEMKGNFGDVVFSNDEEMMHVANQVQEQESGHLLDHFPDTWSSSDIFSDEQEGWRVERRALKSTSNGVMDKTVNDENRFQTPKNQPSLLHSRLTDFTTVSSPDGTTSRPIEDLVSQRLPLKDLNGPPRISYMQNSSSTDSKDQRDSQMQGEHSNACGFESAVALDLNLCDAWVALDDVLGLKPCYDAYMGDPLEGILSHDRSGLGHKRSHMNDCSMVVPRIFRDDEMAVDLTASGGPQLSADGDIHCSHKSFHTLDGFEVGPHGKDVDPCNTPLSYLLGSSSHKFSSPPQSREEIIQPLTPQSFHDGTLCGLLIQERMNQGLQQSDDITFASHSQTFNAPGEPYAHLNRVQFPTTSPVLKPNDSQTELAPDFSMILEDPHPVAHSPEHEIVKNSQHISPVSSDRNIAENADNVIDGPDLFANFQDDEEE